MPFCLSCRLALLSLLAVAVAGAGAQGAEPLPAAFMPSSEVRPGMRGEGRTVFRGFDVETFQAEILGVDHNAYPGSNMILARLSGPLLEQHGVVAGMSGSPVFIDGRLIGAVAYGWSFAYHPYCGITPIEDMWSVWNKVDEAPATTRMARNGAGRPWNYREAWDAYQRRLAGEPAEAQPPPTGFRPSLPQFRGLEGEMRPLMTPVFVSSASPRTRDRLGRFLAGRGLELFAAGGLTGADAAAPMDAPPLQAGSSLGVPMITGDLMLGGVGTVTWADGDRIIAFGHPMYALGPTNAPMSPSRVLGFMQSYNRSFKLAEVGPAIGTITQDRLFAVAGRVGPTPGQVEVRAEIVGEAAHRAREFRFKIWDHPDFMPMMVVTALEEAYLSSVSEAGDYTARTVTRIRMRDGREIEKSFVASSDVFTILSASYEMMFDLFLLTENPFRVGQIDRIDMRTEVNPGIRRDSMLWMEPEYSRYEPGELVQIRARFQEYLGPEYDRVLELRLPEDLKPGTYVLHVADASTAVRIESMARPGQFLADDFDDLIRIARASHVPEDKLYLYLYEPALGVDLLEHSLGGMPVSVESLIQATAPAGLQSMSVGRLAQTQTYDFPAPVYGAQTLLLDVVEHVQR
ncbi:MAG TPA: SpoIVB peptidase S55 domain-containing protein [Candidatus Sumerlaeota bacterium]|nr:SpoIVB peptidase S55 domain-containing protein [Candidatus Sumerlaeota bacterium]HPK02670.1 SpoIVB peptidase S55 domain-containing protein [Candidatus Sumerlaeota bacterium]